MIHTLVYIQCTCYVFMTLKELEDGIHLKPDGARIECTYVLSLEFQ